MTEPDEQKPQEEQHIHQVLVIKGGIITPQGTVLNPRTLVSVFEVDTRNEDGSGPFLSKELFDIHWMVNPAENFCGYAVYQS